MNEPAQETAPKQPHSRAKRIFQALLSVVVIVAVFFFALPKIADFSEVWTELQEMSWMEVVTLAAISIWNLVTYWFVLLASLPGSNVWQVMKVTSTSTAVANSVPGGGAIGVGITYAMYAQSGFTKSAVSRSILITGVWNNFVKLGMPIVALALLAIQGQATGALVVASLIGLAVLVGAVVLFGLGLRSEPAAIRIGNAFSRGVGKVGGLFRRAPKKDWGEGFARFRTDALSLLRDRWLSLTVSTLASHISLYLVLLTCLRHVGVSAEQVTWVEVLAAFAFIRLVTALPITPGGLGVVELGTSAALVAAGGPEAEVVAAVLVYRALTYLLPIPLGLVTYLRWRQRSAERKLRVAAQREEAAQNALAGAEDRAG
jgi:putative heme transporter